MGCSHSAPTSDEPKVEGVVPSGGGKVIAVRERTTPTQPMTTTIVTDADVSSRSAMPQQDGAGQGNSQNRPTLTVQTHQTQPSTSQQPPISQQPSPSHAAQVVANAAVAASASSSAGSTPSPNPAELPSSVLTSSSSATSLGPQFQIRGAALTSAARANRANSLMLPATPTATADLTASSKLRSSLRGVGSKGRAIPPKASPFTSGPRKFNGMAGTWS